MGEIILGWFCPARKKLAGDGEGDKVTGILW